MNAVWKLLTIAGLITASLFAQEKVSPTEDPFAGAVPIPTLEHRLMLWGVPEAQFEEASLKDVVDFIRTISQEVDPDKKGVNIIMTRSAQAVDAKVNLSLKAVSLKDLIEYTCTVTGVDVRFGSRESTRPGGQRYGKQNGRRIIADRSES